MRSVFSMGQLSGPIGGVGGEGGRGLELCLEVRIDVVSGSKARLYPETAGACRVLTPVWIWSDRPWEEREMVVKMIDWLKIYMLEGAILGK